VWRKNNEAALAIVADPTLDLPGLDQLSFAALHGVVTDTQVLRDLRARPLKHNPARTAIGILMVELEQSPAVSV
jgi:hypothetical protein